MNLRPLLTAAAPVMVAFLTAATARAQYPAGPAQPDFRPAPANPGAPGAYAGAFAPPAPAPSTPGWRLNFWPKDTMVYGVNGWAPPAPQAAAPQAGPGASNGTQQRFAFRPRTPPQPVQPPQPPPVMGEFVPAVEITDVTPGGAAARVGLERGDVITRVNGYRVHNTAQLIAQVRASNGAVWLRIKNVRTAMFQDVYVPLDYY